MEENCTPGSPAPSDASCNNIDDDCNGVRDEDYATGLRQQRALATGAKPFVQFGRNEGGGQHFHRFVDELLDVEDDALPRFLEMHAQKNGR